MSRIEIDESEEKEEEDLKEWVERRKWREKSPIVLRVCFCSSIEGIVCGGDRLKIMHKIGNKEDDGRRKRRRRRREKAVEKGSKWLNEDYENGTN